MIKHLNGSHSEAFLTAIENSKLPISEVDATTNFLPKLDPETAELYPFFERATFSVMSQLNPNYEGGLWHLVTLQPEDAPKVPFLYLDDIKKNIVQTQYYGEMNISTETLCLAVGMIAWNTLSWKYAEMGDLVKGQRCSDNFYYLKGYAFDSGLDEVSELYNLID